MKLKIHKGDTVEVISGNYKGEQGEVQSVIRKKNKQGQYEPEEVYVVVSGINLIKKHQRRTGNIRTQVGIIEREGPIHVSKVMLVAPRSKHASRVEWRQTAEGTSARYSPKHDEFID